VPADARGAFGARRGGPAAGRGQRLCRRALAAACAQRHDPVVNLLLLEPGEIDANGCARIGGRRAAHLRAVLRVAVGQRLCAGIADGPLGDAEVLAVGADAVVVRANCTAPPVPSRDVLLLAVPRPKVLLRLLELAAALGFAHVELFRSWRVDKSHLGSRALDPALQRAHLCRGLEQAQRTLLPRVRLHARFRPFVEDVLPTLALPAHRVTGHPDATTAIADLQLGHGAPFALALGPEGGLIAYEVDRLGAAGFLPVRLSPHPLRTEAALAAAHAQLDLLRSRR